MIDLDMLSVVLKRHPGLPKVGALVLDDTENEPRSVRVTWRNPASEDMWKRTNLVIVEEAGIERALLFDPRPEDWDTLDSIRNQANAHRKRLQ